MIKIISFEQMKEWNDTVVSFEHHDVYYLHGYVDAFRLHGDGIPVLIYYKGEQLRGICVVMKRDLSNLSWTKGILQANRWFDFTTPYGYGGWIFDGETSDLNLLHFYIEYKNYMLENNIVCNFIRYSPVLKNAEPMRRIGKVLDLGKTITIDISSEEVIWNNLTSKNRNMIRKAVKNNVEIHHSKPTFELMSIFKQIYDETMRNDQASDYYFFEESFFQSIIERLCDNCEVFYATKSDKIIAISIILYCNGYMHYHLSGTVAEYRKLAPTNLLLYEAALWGCKNGFVFFHLGGGVGSGEDNLYKFKAAFNRSGNCQFSIGQEVFNSGMYDQLVEWRKEKEPLFDANTTFFPVYRYSVDDAKLLLNYNVKKIAIYGAGGLGREVAGGIERINNSLKSEKWELAGFYDDRLEAGAQVSHYGKVLGGMDELNNVKEPLAVAIAVGTPSTRKMIKERITNPNIYFPNLIAPSFKVLDPATFKIGEGNIIQDNCSATCDVTIGSFNVLNGSDVLGHDDVIGDFNVLMPSVHLSGEVRMGDCNLLGVDSVVLQQIKMGNNITLGAGSVLMTKPKDGYTYIGIPAKKFDFK